MPERPKSDYTECWGDIKPFPDLIPVFGLITYLGRSMRDKLTTLKGASITETAKSVLASLAGLGTNKWPEPTDTRAYLRSQLLAVRNMGFAAYHIVPIAAMPFVLQRLGVIGKSSKKVFFSS